MAHFCEHRLNVVQVCAVQEKEINGRQGDHNYRHNAEHGPMIETGFKKALMLAGRGPSHGRELRQAVGMRPCKAGFGTFCSEAAAQGRLFHFKPNA